MAAKKTKKVKLRVAGDGIQIDGRWHHNGDELSVSEAKAKELLKTDGVVRV